jgi:phosphatidate phosphatase APP1
MSRNKPATLNSFRGYGTPQLLFLRGQVLEGEAGGRVKEDAPLLWNAVQAVRRMTSRPLGGARIVARHGGARIETRADDDGLFDVRIEPDGVDPERGWQEVELEVARPRCDPPVQETGVVYVPPSGARRVVISDIDDTIVYTGVANKLKMLWTMFATNAESRVAFPGAAALYRALHEGTGDEGNPMLYVSRGPWTLYDVLDEFFQLNEIPVGPILFLREWGISLRSPLPNKGEGHKMALMREMLALYHDLPFVLIGDSGQRDPEIYADVVEEFPGRVEAIYIRNVSRDPERPAAIRRLAERVVEQGSTLVLADDSFAMACHAAEHGLISERALAAVLAERERDEEESRSVVEKALDLEREEPAPTVEVEGEDPARTREAVAEGEIERKLRQGDDDAEPDARPPNVVVEPD